MESQLCFKWCIWLFAVKENFVPKIPVYSNHKNPWFLIISAMAACVSINHKSMLWKQGVRRLPELWEKSCGRVVTGKAAPLSLSTDLSSVYEMILCCNTFPACVTDRAEPHNAGSLFWLWLYTNRRQHKLNSSFIHMCSASLCISWHLTIDSYILLSVLN